MNKLLKELSALEAELHHPGARCTRERVDQLLHPGFHEVGRSGNLYTRETVLGFLAGQGTPRSVVSDQYAVHLLAPDCALLTYRSVQKAADGSWCNHALRSSVWLRTSSGAGPDRWQLFYHQGTPAVGWR